MAIDTETIPATKSPEEEAPKEATEPTAPSTPERLATEQEIIDAINHFARNDAERARARYGERGLLGFLGKVNSWLHKEGTRMEAKDLENVGKWEKNGKWKKWLKMGLKVGGGIGIAAAMTFTGGLGAVLTPILWSGGVREAWNGLLEVGEELGWGRKRTKNELGTQEKMTEIIEGMKADFKTGKMTEDMLRGRLNEMFKADMEIFETQNKNLTQERRQKFIRSIASSALTLGTGFLTGVPLGTADYDAGTTPIGESGEALAETHKVSFHYNPLDEKGVGGFFEYGKEAPYTGFANEAEFAKSIADDFNYPLTQYSDIFGRTLHTLGHGLPLDAKLGLFGAAGELIGRNVFDKFWPSTQMEPPKPYNLSGEYPEYPEYPTAPEKPIPEKSSVLIAPETKEKKKPEKKELMETEKEKGVILTDIVRNRIDDITNGLMHKEKYQKMLALAVTAAKEKKSDYYNALKPMSLAMYKELKDKVIKDERVASSNVKEEKIAKELKNIINDNIRVEAAKETDIVTDDEAFERLEKIVKVFSNKEEKKNASMIVQVLLGKEDLPESLKGYGISLKGGKEQSEFSISKDKMGQINRSFILSRFFYQHLDDLTDENIQFSERLKLVKAMLAEFRNARQEILQTILK